MSQWNTGQWNMSQWNAGGFSLPLARFTTVQPGDTLNVFGFYYTDPLYFGFTVDDGVVDGLQSATFKISNLISLTITGEQSANGLIVASGTNDYEMYFIVDPTVLSPEITYDYFLTATDINSRTATWAGFFRTII